MQGISESAADSAVTQFSSIDDLVASCVDRSTPFSHRDKIAFGVMTAIIISAGISTIWMPNEQNEPTNVVVNALVSPLPSANYPAQIERLRIENKILLKEIDALGAETIDLNIKLLQLELAMRALELSAKPLTEVRSVYNFINNPEEGVLTSNLIANAYTQLSWESEADGSPQKQVIVQHDNPIQSQDSFLHDDTAIAWESQFEMEFVEALAGPSGTGDINQ